MRNLYVTPLMTAIVFGLTFLVGRSAADLSKTQRATGDSVPEPTPASATIPLPPRNSPYHSVYQPTIKGYNRSVPSVDERLVPLPKHRLNVKEFGAKGDGRSDDTLAIRRALATARSAGGAAIYFPAGIYNFAPQPTDKGWSPETFKSGDPYAVFDLSFSNVALVGGRPKKERSIFPLVRFDRSGQSLLGDRKLLCQNKAQRRIHNLWWRKRSGLN
jgi:hypothetical protein